MVKRILIFITIVLFGSCSKKLFELAMAKTPYTGSELRIDGYYYSDLTLERYINIAIFYRDGFCIHTRIIPINQDTLTYIENEILLNTAFISKIKSIPGHIGVFQIMYPDIKFETWEARTATFSHFGKIVNDTTFIINKQVDNRTNTTYSENLTYRFKKFSPKPDSTNAFVK